MKKYIHLLVFMFYSLSLSSTVEAQNTLAKLKFEDAEKAFSEGNYNNCINLLDESEELYGETTASILHLRIMAEGQILLDNPNPDEVQVKKVKELCARYMNDFDIVGLEDKFRDVYELTKILPETKNRKNKAQPLLFPTLKKESVMEEDILVQYNLVHVEGGTFFLGHKNPVREVSVSDFYIGKYEVTTGEYNKFLNHIGKRPLRKPENVPAIYLTWDDAMAYCLWLQEKHGGVWRLPTEAEWEYAAMGGNKSKGYEYSGSNVKEEVVVYKKIAPVGSLKPNELGIYDMTGNVLEWCYDTNNEGYYKNGPSHNPMGLGPKAGNYRVLKGGSWKYRKFSIGDRVAFPHNVEGSGTGFRVVYIPN